MDYFFKNFKKSLVFVCLTFIFFIYGCNGRETYNQKNFVGKWKSSKLETPVYLYANGEWEIKTDDGGVLQYGIWELKNKQIVWSYKIGSSYGRDPNDVLSVTPREFRVEERDGAITTFSKLD